MNYYSLEHDNQFMSCSQYDMWEQCEAKYIAYLEGNYTREETTPFLVGNYIHSWLDGSQEKFKELHPNIFTKKGDLKSEYQEANTMIEVLKEDPFCMDMLSGTCEATFFGNLFGLPWKIRVDKWKPGLYRVVDLKTTRSIQMKYEGGISFIEKYKYQRRAAVYAEIVRQFRNEKDYPHFYIVAISKETTPDKIVIDMTDFSRWEEELYYIKNNVERIKLLRNKQLIPVRCERCNYCKSTKKLSEIVYYKNILEV